MERPYYQALGEEAFEAIGSVLGPLLAVIIACVVTLAIIASLAVTIIKAWDLVVVPWWRDVFEGVAQGLGCADYDTSER